jgi:hypothetical protein
MSDKILAKRVRTVRYVHEVGNIEVRLSAGLLVGPKALVIVRTATRRSPSDSMVFLTPHDVPRVG